MTTDTKQQVNREWETLAAVQHFLPATVVTAVNQRMTHLLQQTTPDPGTPSASQSVQTQPRPLVKRLGTTPQPLSDLFVIQ
jgi:hypothetical protein